MFRCCLISVRWFWIVALFAVSACGTTTGGGGFGYVAGDTSGKDLGLTSDATATGGDVVSLADGVASDATAGETVNTDTTQDVGPVDGGCGAKPCCANAGDCDDNDACTTDACAAGYCTHTPIAGCGNASPPCNASAPCAFGVCDSVTSACVACITSADCGGGALCADQKCVPATACKSDVTCKAAGKVCEKTLGVCVECIQNGDCGADAVCTDHACHASKACTSSKECTSVCNLASGICVECLSADDCATEKFCNASHQCQADVCAAGACQPGKYFACKPDGSGYGVATTCEDGNPCTDNICDTQKGCQVVPNKAACNDENACTQTDTCAAGTCKGAALNCDDKNPCTTDSCDPATGCAHVPNTNACDDANACTLMDVCAGGLCKGGAVNCDDTNGCTTDSCDPATGCVHTDNTIACNDKSACTTNDACAKGSCKGTAIVCDDSNPCTSNQCTAAGGCSYPSVSGPCDDGDACTIADACYLGYCNPGAAKNCTDSNACTDDGCSGGTCSHGNNTIACDDGNACTTNDACGGGKCQVGPTAVVCDDFNLCTNDACVPATGCSYKSNALACDDGNACTVSDVCQGGSCAGGSAKVCSDGDACTADACDPTKGCLFAVDSAKCDDKDVCTLDACTSPGGACKHTAIVGCCKDQATCNDNNACTNDTCAGNTCFHQTAASCCAADKDCGDGNQCTTDTCNGGTCGHVALAGAVTPTWVANWDTVGAAEGFVGDTVPGGFLWGEGVTLPQDGTGSFGLTGTSGAFTGLKTTLASTATGPFVLVPAGGTYALSLWYRLDLTAGSGTITVNALLGNSTVQLGTSTVLNTWSQLKIDATALAGQKVQLQFKVQINGTTSTPAAGKGAFFDTLSLAGACPNQACSTSATCPASLNGCFAAFCNGGSCAYNRTCCTAASDCDDGNGCTTDACSSLGACTHTAIANCCANSAGCDDKNACTLDVCSNGACSHPAIAGCCLSASDCGDADACTNDVCDADHTCKHPALCCKIDGDCNDGDAKCTTDTCVSNVCQYKTNIGVAGCCDPNVYAESFDGAVPSWTYSNSLGVGKGWQQWLTATQSVSAPGVLYYGDPVAKNFSFTGTSYGHAYSPAILLPATTDKLTLTMKVYFDSESGSYFDKLTIAISGSTAFWANTSGTVQTWNTVTYDVTALAGKSITLDFYFNTGDGSVNDGLGILVDDIRVTRTCP